MPVQLSWFKHVTLNHGTAGSSPATGTKNPASALKIWLLLQGDFMKDNVMYYPAIILMIVEAGALIFLITEWIKANNNK